MRHRVPADDCPAGALDAALRLLDDLGFIAARKRYKDALRRAS